MDILNVVLEDLKEIDYKFSVKNSGYPSVVLLEVNEGLISIRINTKSSRFEIEGSDLAGIRTLESQITERIRKILRDEALDNIYLGSSEWLEWRNKYSAYRIDLSFIEIEEDLDNYTFENINFDEITMKYLRFNGCAFSNASIQRAIIEGCIFKSTIFKDIHGLETKIDSSIFRSCTFLNADFTSSSIKESDFSHIVNFRIILKGARLNNVNLRKTDLVNVEIDTKTKLSCKYISKGINGFYNETTDTSAIVKASPPGNSMRGSSPEAVLESLNRARKYFGISLFTSIGALVFTYVGNSTAKIPFFNLDLNLIQYVTIGIIISIVLLSLTYSFLYDAFEGMKFLKTRESAMKVANFPWIMTRFSGEGKIQKGFSFVFRTGLCFHPIIYLYVLLETNSHTTFLTYSILVTELLSIALTVYSQNFQTPLLFNKEVRKLDSL